MFVQTLDSLQALVPVLDAPNALCLVLQNLIPVLDATLTLLDLPCPAPPCPAPPYPALPCPALPRPALPCPPLPCPAPPCPAGPSAVTPLPHPAGCHVTGQALRL